MKKPKGVGYIMLFVGSGGGWIQNIITTYTLTEERIKREREGGVIKGRRRKERNGE